jgi:hypothetical protein
MADASLSQMAESSFAQYAWKRLMHHVERVDLLLQRHYHQRAFVVWTGDVLLAPDEIEQRIGNLSGAPAWMDFDDRANARESVVDAVATVLADEPFGYLTTRFGLNAFERDVILLGLLPHMDSRYQTLLSLLQGRGQHFPTIELALRLFCANWEDRQKAQSNFLPEAPLSAYQLIQPVSSAALTRDGWGRMPLLTSLEVWHFLLGNRYQAPALDRFCRWLSLDANAASTPGVAALQSVLRRAVFEAVTPSVVTLRDARETDVVHALATFGHGALALDLARLPTEDEDALQMLRQALRNARLHRCAVLVKSLDEVGKARPALLEPLARCLSEIHIPTICVADSHSPVTRLPGAAQVVFDPPAMTSVERARALDRYLDDPRIDTVGLSRRFSFHPDELAAIRQEVLFYRYQRAPDGCVEACDWTQALRYRARQNFGNLAQRIEPRRTLNDLIASPELRQQLDEISAAIRFREELLELGFADKVHYGTGISALFYGPSGTGKTMAAEAMAKGMRTDLIKVDLSSVVNKYVGETEKNLARIFDMAQADAGVLFFDEADALFGKRSQVKDAQDRHANIEVSYLLQRLEEFPGLVILATNNRGHMDEGFIRRFTFVTRFAFPDAALRELMWKAIWPAQIEVDEQIDFAQLAARIEVTGASIRNIAMLAGWLAKSERAPRVMMRHIEQACARELAKVGRLQI